MENVKIEPFNFIGIAIRTTNENGKSADDIAELWSRFINDKALETIPNKVDETIYSIYTDYESDHTKPYTTILGCKVENLNSIPNGMIGRSFSGGKYVKLTARGNIMNSLIINKWAEIWKMNLERSFTADFEVFGAKAQNPTDAEIDFLIAVK